MIRKLRQINNIIYILDEYEASSQKLKVILQLDFYN